MGQQSVVVDYTERDEDWLAGGEAAAIPEQTDNNIIVRGISCILVWSVTQCKVTWPPLCLRRAEFNFANAQTE